MKIFRSGADKCAVERFSGNVVIVNLIVLMKWKGPVAK
jgi:hypothetical protein